MIGVDWPSLTLPELLSTHSAVLEELRRRNVVRSKNNPTGDYAEWLVSAKLGLQLQPKSAKGYDAIDSSGVRYQIKGRRVTADNPSRQLGVIRNLEGNDFDVLIAVVFDAAWEVVAAARMPRELVAEVSAFRHHVNGHVIHLRSSLLRNARVEDVTALLR